MYHTPSIAAKATCGATTTTTTTTKETAPGVGCLRWRAKRRSAG